jgi:hypothetical protein
MTLHPDGEKTPKSVYCDTDKENNHIPGEE